MFGMPRESPKLNHLAFADDMIILCKAEVKNLQLVITVLDKYEEISGQKINKEKSAIYMHKGVSHAVRVLAEVATVILIREFPFINLGCPIFYMRNDTWDEQLIESYSLMKQQIMFLPKSSLQQEQRRTGLYGVLILKDYLQLNQPGSI